jgi:hypothetical protein
MWLRRKPQLFAVITDGLKSLRENLPVQFVPTTNHRVPHISLVFREMWDTTASDLHCSALQELPIEVRGIPHLAKNERDMGHPMIRGRDRNRTGRFSRRLFRLSPSTA